MHFPGTFRMLVVLKLIHGFFKSSNLCIYAIINAQKMSVVFGDNSL